MEHKFIKELNGFFLFLEPINESKQLKSLLMNFTHLNFKKIAEFIYKAAIDDKVDILKHNTDLFTNQKFYFPTLDISPIVNSMNADQLNTFWEKFCRIFIYSQCITTGTNAKTIESNDFSINDLIKEYEIENENTETGSNPLELFFDGDLLNKKIQEAETSDFTEFTDKIANILPSANNPEFKQKLNDIIKDIFDDLKHIDFTTNSVFTVIQSLAKKFADKLQLSKDTEFTKNIVNMMSDFITTIKSDDTLTELIKDADPETKKMINMTTDFIKKTDLKNDDIGKIMQNFNDFAIDKLPEIMKKKGISDEQIKKILANPKNYGIDAKQMTSMNRKTKRKIAQLKKK